MTQYLPRTHSAWRTTLILNQQQLNFTTFNFFSRCSHGIFYGNSSCPLWLYNLWSTSQTIPLISCILSSCLILSDLVVLSHLVSSLLRVWLPRSQSQHLLTIPRARLKTYGDRAFSHTGPTLWNNLPQELKTARTLNVLMKKLRTYMCGMTYDYSLTACDITSLEKTIVNRAINHTN